MSNEEIKAIPLLVYADELVDKLREMLPRAIREGDSTAIHQARVSTRRLKAAVDVFKPITTRSHRREMVSTLKKLRSHLGPARDLDVMIGHLKDIKIDRLKPGVKWMTAQLDDQHKALYETEAQVFDIARGLARLGAWWGVREEWAQATDGLHCLVSESLHLQLDRFIEHADAVSGLRETTVEQPIRDPHQLRIAGKALRYTLEMAVAGGRRLPAAVARSFKRMQDALGLWHDFVVLGDCVLQLSLKSQLGHRDSQLQALALDLAKLASARSQTQLLRFNKLWKEKGEMLATTIRHAFPLTHPVPLLEITETKTDPDPPDSESPPVGEEAVVADAPSVA